MVTGMKKIAFLCLFALSSVVQAAHADPTIPGLQWQSNSLSYLHGNDYKLGDKSRDIITYEHASGWRYGDLFIFADFTDPLQDQYSGYGEIHPRASLGKIMEKDLSVGIFKDALIAAEVEIGSDDHRAYLYGLGFDFNLPRFQYFSLNVYARDQVRLHGRTYQISPAWSLPFEIKDIKMTLDGFADIDGGEGTRVPSILFVPQLMLDVGHLWGMDNKILIGTEWQYWDNKYGVKGADESVFQSLVKVKF
jgi:nucleoside-specific outer membrane channel protein Tsx